MFAWCWMSVWWERLQNCLTVLFSPLEKSKDELIWILLYHQDFSTDGVLFISIFRNSHIWVGKTAFFSLSKTGEGLWSKRQAGEIQKLCGEVRAGRSPHSMVGLDHSFHRRCWPHMHVKGGFMTVEPWCSSLQMRPPLVIMCTTTTCLREQCQAVLGIQDVPWCSMQTQSLGGSRLGITVSKLEMKRGCRKSVSGLGYEIGAASQLNALTTNPLSNTQFFSLMSKTYSSVWSSWTSGINCSSHCWVLENESKPLELSHPKWMNLSL